MFACTETTLRWVCRHANSHPLRTRAPISPRATIRRHCSNSCIDRNSTFRTMAVALRVPKPMSPKWTMPMHRQALSWQPFSAWIRALAAVRPAAWSPISIPKASARTRAVNRHKVIFPHSKVSIWMDRRVVIWPPVCRRAPPTPPLWRPVLGPAALPVAPLSPLPLQMTMLTRTMVCHYLHRTDTWYAVFDKSICVPWS